MGDVPLLKMMSDDAGHGARGHSAITTGVTVTVAHRVRVGREAAFHTWVGEMAAAARAIDPRAEFTVLEPADAARGQSVVVGRFTDAASLHSWEESPAYAQWLIRLAPLVRGARRRSVASTLDDWYTIAYRPDLPPPPRYRLFVVSVIGIYPLLVAFGVTVAHPIGRLPIVARPLVTAALLLTVMQYLIMPRLTRLFASWLYPVR